MLESHSALDQLIHLLTRLPGIGHKTAQRLAYHLLKTSQEDVQALADAMLQLRRDMRTCSICYNLDECDPCTVCADQKRDPGILCVVEEAGDVALIEKSHYQGRYHVLGGTLSPIDGRLPEDLTIVPLLERIAKEPIREVIVATNPSTVGEVTATYVVNQLRSIRPELRITRIARGLPVGGDLEYADAGTIAKALEGRTEVE